MKAKRRGPFHFIFIFILAIVVLRFFPLILQLIQAMALGLRALWWVVLPTLFAGWVVWRWEKRKSVETRSEEPFQTESLRDVTNSMNPPP